MSTIPFHLSEYIDHCIRDYTADLEFIKEGCSSLKTDTQWDIASLVRQTQELVTTLKNIQKEINVHRKI